MPLIAIAILALVLVIILSVLSGGDAKGVMFLGAIFKIAWLPLLVLGIILLLQAVGSVAGLLGIVYSIALVGYLLIVLINRSKV